MAALNFLKGQASVEFTVLPTVTYGTTGSLSAEASFSAEASARQNVEPDSVSWSAYLVDGRIFIATSAFSVEATTAKRWLNFLETSGSIDSDPDIGSVYIWADSLGDLFLRKDDGQDYAIATTSGLTADSLQSNFIAGEALTAYSPVVSGVSGVLIAKASEISHAGRILGIIETTALLGDSLPVTTSGKIVNLAWNWDVTLPVFLAPNGGLTQTVPTDGASVFSQVVGLPVSETAILLISDSPIILT